MLSKVLSSSLIGIDAYVVDVEVDISYGLPRFTVVGLPETAVKESKERVKSAINNSGYRFPDDNIIVNLAPAHLKKDGTGFDLPIAIGILAATKILPQEILSQYLILGELSLNGEIKPVKGALSSAIVAKNTHYKGIIVPVDNSKEAAVIQGIETIPARNLADLVEFLRGVQPIASMQVDIDQVLSGRCEYDVDFSEVVGQEHGKRALEVAAAGRHNVLMLGPPGSGKTMLARRIPTILPPLIFEEAIETTRIFSIMGLVKKGQALIMQRPFRAPHHTVSDAGLIGGGHVPRPGEVSLAHNGVLFLDELAEYKRPVLEGLRQPLEDKEVTISRALTSITYPCSFMLIAAMNPCPCGYLGDVKHECKCSPNQVQKYRAKVSGPLLDRIDMHLEIPAISWKDLANDQGQETSAPIRDRVMAAHSIQQERFKRHKIYANAQMGNRHLKKFCHIDVSLHGQLENAVEKFGLSARAYNRILKIARTIADLDQSDKIQEQHLFEAIQFRSLDREKFGF